MQKRGKFPPYKVGTTLVFTQIFLIVFSVVSFAFLIGETQRVSGQEEGGEPTWSLFDKLLGRDKAWQAGREAGTTPNPTESGFFGKLYSGEAFGATPGKIPSALMQGAVWGLSVYMGVKLLTTLFGVDKNVADALSTAAGVGTFAGFFSSNLIGSAAKDTLFGIDGLTQGVAGPIIGITVGVVVFILLYKSEKEVRVDFQCLPFEAPVGGGDCEKCNADPFRPCSEYRCRALGQACEIVNSGTTEEKCAWVNPNDASPPTITPWQEPLTEKHKYTNHDTRPPSLGAKIVREDVSNGCLQAFTPLSFGITTNEPAQCKIDIVHKDTLDEMSFFFGKSNFYLYNHTQVMSLPSPDAINSEAPELQNDGRYNLFVRCRDKNGNENVGEFDFQFCVDPSPDTTPPIIVDTSIKSGSYISYNSGETPMEIYVNEPSECKWSVQDKAYEEMEQEMQCATKLTEINARELYTCSTTLTGIVDRQENNYYFRCKDQPKKPDNERNVNVGSYNLNLLGSQPLSILSVAPNETITGSTEVVEIELYVKTDDGAKEGEAVCYFSDSGEEGSYVAMFDSGGFEHRQVLTLISGDYNYFFRCIDAGGNSAEDSTSFNVFVDVTEPMVARAYHFLDTLKIVTNEPAECTYSLNSCNFNIDEGIKMIHNPATEKTTSYAEWKPNIVYYIKCADEFGNQPAPNQCSLTASATNIV
ncbi:MAG: hypothetical protein Q8P57_05005 [Candidatus Pacearchaeota archaeon]|nr:hypothetical protein [Candidatus Pacearchaeota archaeon]